MKLEIDLTKLDDEGVPIVGKAPAAENAPTVHMAYVGARPNLKGCTALTRLSRNQGYVVAQFDDVDTSLGYGWHELEASSFAKIVDAED